MRFMKLIVLSVFSLIIFGCEKHHVVLTSKVQKREIANEEDFDIFLDRFNTDSSFQISRVNFPVKVVEFNTEKLTEDTLILNQTNYHFNQINKKSKDYTIEKVIASDSAEVLLKGIDNGIYREFFFSKKNGIWKLNTWNDLST